MPGLNALNGFNSLALTTTTTTTGSPVNIPGLGDNLIAANAYNPASLTGVLWHYELLAPFYTASGSNISTLANWLPGTASTLTVKSGGGSMPVQATGVLNASGQKLTAGVRLNGINGLQHNGLTWPTGSFSLAYLIEMEWDSQKRFVGATLGESVTPNVRRLTASSSRFNAYYNNGSGNVISNANDYQLFKGQLALVVWSYNSATNEQVVWINGEKLTFTGAMAGPWTDDFIGVQNTTFTRSTGLNAMAYWGFNRVLTDAEMTQLFNYYCTLLGYTYDVTEVCGSSIVQNDPTGGSDGANGSTDLGNRNWFAQYLRLLHAQDPAKAARLHFVNHGRSGQGIVHHLNNQATIYGNWTKPAACGKVNLVIAQMMTNDLTGGRTPTQCRDDLRSFVDQRLATNRYNNGLFAYCTDIARGASGSLNGAGGLLKQTRDLIAADMAPGGYLDTAVRAKGMTPYFVDFGGSPYFDVVNGNTATSASYSNVTINGVTYGSGTPVKAYQADFIHPTHFGTAALGQIFYDAVGG